MSAIISTTNQTRWKDCFASSAKVGLTLRSNGEEPVLVYTDARQLVPAGFEAPTVAPTVADAGAGSLTAGYVVYRYVYASSLYPNVEAVTTAGGEVWPKSNPSPASAPYSITASHSNNVTVTKTTRSDVDTIFIYRTAIKSTSAEAVALGAAGELFCVGAIGNDGIAGAVVFADNALVAQEQLEIDNFTAPQFWLCVYEDPYWWGIGNPDLTVSVTLNGTTAATASAATFFSGRQNQFVTFDGINSGGFDGRGTFYFKYLSATVANVTAAVDGTAATIPATGTTTMRVRGYAATLYRSKPRNPFAWGFTNYLSSSTGSVVREPEQYAFPMGGHAVAIAVLPDARLLKIDCENPSACYTLNLNLAGQDGFEQSKRVIDRQHICSSHFSQIVARFPGGESMLCGLDSANQSIIKANSSNQGPFGDEVFDTLRKMIRYNDNPRLYHGVYNPDTELSCWWIKTAYGVPSLEMGPDTCLCFHGPSGQWSLLRDLDVTASATVFDPYYLQTFTLVGTAQGQVANAFILGAGSFPDNETIIRTVTALATGRKQQYLFHFTLGALEQDYIDLPADTGGVLRRIWFHYATSASNTPPATPAGGSLLRVTIPTVAVNTATVAQTTAALVSAGLTGGGSSSGNVYISQGVVGAIVGSPSLGSYVRDGSATLAISTTGDNVYRVTVSEPYPPVSTTRRWMLISDPVGENDLWLRVTSESGGTMTIDTVFDPATSNTSAFALPPVGGYAYLGVTNCEARTYFQPNQTRPGQAREFWSALRNVGEETVFFRYYQEFDTGMTGAALVPVQDPRRATGGSNTGLNWVTRGLPSALNEQFGMRLIERGYAPFEVLGLNIKVASS